MANPKAARDEAARAKAQEMRAKAKEDAAAAVAEADRARLIEADKTNRLRALRLAKEAAYKEAADKESDASAAETKKVGRRKRTVRY